MDVGMTEAQKKEIAELSEVVRMPRNTLNYNNPRSVMYIPSADARIMALEKFPDDNTLVLYLDGDTLVYGSVAPLVKSFLDSGSFLGIGSEEYGWYPDILPKNHKVSAAWADQKFAETFFLNYKNWKDKIVLNTGVMLTHGNKCKKFGDELITKFITAKKFSRWGEQSLISSMLYEKNINFYKIPIEYNCYVVENSLLSYQHRKSDPFQVNSKQERPLFKGKPIIIRHFCGSNGNRNVLKEILASRGVSQCNCAKCLHERKAASSVASKSI